MEYCLNILIGILLLLMIVSIGRCNEDEPKTLYDMIYTSSDGFVYYYDEKKDEGSSLFDFPNYENVIIPEYASIFDFLPGADEIKKEGFKVFPSFY